MNHERLDDSNFILFAAKNYDSSGCHNTIEFNEDLKRIKYIKKLISRYQSTGELKERLILNHVTVLYNVFGAEALPRILFLKCSAYLHYIKPFLILLNVLPEIVFNINGKNYITDDIPMDQIVVDRLRKI